MTVISIIAMLFAYVFPAYVPSAGGEVVASLPAAERLLPIHDHVQDWFGR